MVQEWPNRASMLKSIDMQLSAGTVGAHQWIDYSRSRWAVTSAA